MSQGSEGKRQEQKEVPAELAFLMRWLDGF